MNGSLVTNLIISGKARLNVSFSPQKIQKSRKAYYSLHGNLNETVFKRYIPRICIKGDHFWRVNGLENH